MFSVPFGPDPSRFAGSRSSNLPMKSFASSENSGLMMTGLSVINENNSLQFLE